MTDRAESSPEAQGLPGCVPRGFQDPDAQRYLDVALGERSTHTATAYRRDIEAFAYYARRSGVTCWSAVAPELIRAWLAARHASGLNPRSLKRALSALRFAIRTLLSAGVLTADPTAGLKTPRAARLLPRALDVDAVQGLLEQASGTPLQIRDRAMFELAYSCGLRVSELVGVRLEDLDVGEGWVRVIGKRDKQRQLPVGRTALDWIGRWRAVRREWLAGKRVAWLFISERGQGLSTRTVQRRLAAWARQAGLPEHVHPHQLRHSFASHMLESSGDLRAVQELLGHADISTTQVYTRLDFQHLASVYDAAHPRARKHRD